MTNKYNLDMEKVRANSISHDDFMQEQLQNEEFRREYLNVTIQEFIEDGDYDFFFRSLEDVIKAQSSLSEFSKRSGVTRKALYDMFKGERVPRLDTIGRILKELGFELRVA